ncbi:hypothetical protein D3C72_1367700 [compost metagenome]
MIAKALCREPGTGNSVVNVTGVGAVAGCPGRLDAITPGAVTAKVRTGFKARRLLAGFGFHIHHAAGGIAVEGGKRPAQHLHLFNRVKVNVRRLALTIRHGGRNTIDINTYAAHAIH